MREARADAAGPLGAREGRRAPRGFGRDRSAERQTESDDALDGGVARLASLDDILEPNNVRAGGEPVVVEGGPGARMPAHVRVPARGLAAAARGARPR